MSRTTSVAMTAEMASALTNHLDRADGQEDICLATYMPSTGHSRTTALLSEPILPTIGERYVHGNATVTGEYILRAIAIAQEHCHGVALLHSHPGATQWQRMSSQDRDAESSYANLIRESTNLPLVGMTLATGDGTWSARHWDKGVGRSVDCTSSTNVRVISEQLLISWNNDLCPVPAAMDSQLRTISSWGERQQASLARQRIMVVGAGSVGLDVVLRLMASGHSHVTVMDYDMVETHNLDRLIGAKRRDVRLMRSKTHVARREGLAAATAHTPNLLVSDLSICEPAGLKLALDHDLIFCCVDRPWPRAILNSVAYDDLIPVIDGGIAIDTFSTGEMRNATWRSHVIRPGRPCMVCNNQLDQGLVIIDKKGLLDSPAYIQGADPSLIRRSENVSLLSASVSSSMLAQYVSYCVAPGTIGDPGPLQYWLSTHHLERLDVQTRPFCLVEMREHRGDQRNQLTDRHRAAEHQRRRASMPGIYIRVLRLLDWVSERITRRLDGHH